MFQYKRLQFMPQLIIALKWNRVEVNGFSIVIILCAIVHQHHLFSTIQCSMVLIQKL